MERVTVKPSGCWLWNGSLTDGYGSFYLDGRNRKAHIASYVIFVGSVPEGKVLDHLCRIRDCVNPEHLEPVTQQVNVLRGEGIAAVNARKTHCKNGHEFTPENIYWFRGLRYCRACHSKHSANYHERKRNEKAIAN